MCPGGSRGRVARLVSARQDPAALSRKRTVPVPEPRTAIQYGRPATTAPPVTGMVVQAPAAGVETEPCATSSPGWPPASA